MDRLAKRGGKVLLVGVGHIANTTIHVGEEYAGVPKAPWAIGLPIVKVLMPDGSTTTCQLDTSSSCSAAFGPVEYKLRQNKLIQDLRLGPAALQLMRGADVIDCVHEMVKDKPDILLCTNPECKPCTGARQNIHRGIS
jgi:aminoglycoside N3'-acetyltransferase